MKNHSPLLQRASVYVVLMIALQVCAGLALAQGQRKPVPSNRGLKVSRQPDAGQPQRQQEDPNSPAPAGDKPQLIVQLGDYISSVAYSADGRFVLTGGSRALLWDAATGQEIRRFVGHSIGVPSVAFSPDGKTILTGGSLDKTARIWNIATGKEIKRLMSPGEVRTVAYSPDGRFVLTGGDPIARLWDAATGREIRRFIGHSAFVVSVKFSPDGRYVLTGSTDKTARLWDISTGREVRRLLQGNSKNSNITSVAFSPDGRFILTCGQFDQTARLWDVGTGKALKDFKYRNWLSSVAFSPDGRSVLAAGDNNSGEDSSPILWDLATGGEISRFAGHSIGGVKSVAFSPDGRFVLTGGGDSTARIWDIVTGKETKRFEGYSSTVHSVAFSSDGQSILTGSDDQSARLWDLTSGRETRQFVGHSSGVSSVVSSPDSRCVLTSSGTSFGGRFDNTARLWETATGKELVRYSPGESRLIEIASIVFSPDGKTVAAGILDYQKNNPVVLWDIATGKEMRRFVGHPHGVSSLAYSPDGRFILTAGISTDGTARLWDVARGEEVKRFQGPKAIIAYATLLAYSPDGKYVLTTDDAQVTKQNVRLWDVNTGNEIRRFRPSDSISSVRFSPDGRSILTAGRGGVSLWDVATAREIRRIGKAGWVLSAAFSPDGRFIVTEGGSSAVLWDAATGQELCEMISFKDGRWVVVTLDGRFDTNDLEEIKGLHWIMPDDPLRALPLEIFMQEYYEPRLLPRILAGEKLRPIKSLSDLNRVQPNVSITGIHYQGDARDTVTVTLEVSKAKAEFQRGDKRVELETGVYDVRLFRDGQLVGYAPKAGREITIDPAANKEIITFRNIKLPRKKDVNQVEFSAYAFNVDRVKSATARSAIGLVKELPPIKGRAYLITFGANAYEQESFDLNFAANDARQVQKIVFNKLSITGEYAEVVQVPLISDYEIRNAKKVVTEKAATKNNLKVILELLSGKYVDPELKKAIPNADKIRRARPEDLVLISFSSHGFADDHGNFYFVPYDTGPVQEQRVTEGLLKHCISSEELSLWLRDVDAGEMVMIADACHSAATVDVEGFKPGPMGSRGLGQLAYDKRMRILTSTQADDVALESELIKQGLLTYALTHDGIEAGQADFKPKDKTITLAEWLEYGVSRVPALYEEVKRGELQSFGQGAGKRGLVHSAGKKDSETSAASTARRKGYQQPSLFDFSKRRSDVVLDREGTR